MRSKYRSLLFCASLAACSVESTTSTGPKEFHAGDVPQATAHLSIQAATPAAASPFQLQAFTAAGVTIEAATIVVAEVNLKGWEYEDESHDSESDDEADEDSGDELDTASFRAQEDGDASVESETEDGEDSEGESETEDSEVENVDFKGPFVVDLLTGLSEPALGDAVLPSGAYSQVEFKLDAPEDATTAASIEIAGQIDIDGTYHPFVLRNLRDEELKWDFAAPVSMSATAVNDLVLRIPLDQWVNAALLQAMGDAYRDGSVVPGADGVLVFTTETGSVADIFEANLEAKGEMEHDDDEDGEEESETED